MVLSMLNVQSSDAALDGTERDKLINEVIDQINAEFPPAVLTRPTPAERAKVIAEMKRILAGYLFSV